MLWHLEGRNDMVKVQEVVELRVILSAFEGLSEKTLMEKATHD